MLARDEVPIMYLRKPRLSFTGTYMQVRYLGTGTSGKVGRNRMCCLHVRTVKNLSRKRASAVVVREDVHVCTYQVPRYM